MKRLEYKTPELEVINIETEDTIMVIASTTLDPGQPGQSANANVIIQKSSVSSYSMDDYSWK